MAIQPADALNEATEAVLAELLKVYDNVSADDVRPFARAVAQAAKVAVQHVADHAVVQVSGEGIE